MYIYALLSPTVNSFSKFIINKKKKVKDNLYKRKKYVWKICVRQVGNRILVKCAEY